MTAYDGIAFAYDGRGRRISKGNVTFTYGSDGRLVKQSDGLAYIYDASGLAGVEYNNATYLYRKDAQGNITAILDSSGNVVVQYVCDAWGKHEALGADGAEITDASHIGNMNPYRYRGYYYDRETGLYYLQTRYYDPETGRFINADGIEYLDPDSVNGLNLYAYCGNNPVMNVDPTGHKWYEFWKWDWGKIAGWIVTDIVAVAATVAVVAGTVFTGGLLGAILVSTGIGTMAGITGSIALQGGIQNIGNINPWKVALTGVIGGTIGAATGAFSYGISVIGAGAGQSFGYALSQSFIGGLKVAKVFSSALLMGAGKFAGSIVGGLIGTAIGDYFINTAQGKPTTFGGIIESESSSWITDLIRWLFS